MMKLKQLPLILLLSTGLLAQVPKPAPPQKKAIALVGGTAHLGNGQIIEAAIISFENGKLTAVTDQTSIRINRGTHDIIDITGKHVYPGLIATNSILGLNEVESLKATRDFEEQGDLNPSARAIIAYNTDSEVIPTMRFNGVLLAQITPQGSFARGQSSVVQLDGWNWEDAAFETDNGVHFTWPLRIARNFSFRTFTMTREKNEAFPEQIAALHKLFADAKAHGKDTKNLKLASLQGLFDGSKTMFVHTNNSAAMVDSVRFARKYGIQKIAIIGGHNALDVASFLKEEKVPVILEDVYRLPQTDQDDIDGPYTLPAKLHEAGLTFAITVDDLQESRNLAFHAGTAAAYGLDKEVALSTITLVPAQILGIADRVGSLEVGKDATLFISEGDVMDIRTSIVTHAFIQGRAIELNGMQQRLYERFHEKYAR